LDTLEKILIAVFCFVITSVLGYLFRMRQLYIVVPKLYKHALIAGKGSLCEIIIYNKGKQVEEDIRVEIDPDLKCELIAASSNEMEFERSVIKLPRMHKGSENSAILMVENGILDFSKIMSISSKNAKGRPIKLIDNVPVNYANGFLGIILAMSILPSMYYGEKFYRFMDDKYMVSKMSGVFSLGWTDIHNYYGSDLRKSYSDREFPIAFEGFSDDGKIRKVTFQLFNKTAVSMNVHGRFVEVDEKSKDREFLTFALKDVAAMSKDNISIRIPKPLQPSDSQMINFSIRIGDDFTHSLMYKIPTQ